MKPAVQKHQTTAAQTVPAAARTVSSNELVRLHLLQMAAEAKQEAQKAQPVAQRQPTMPTKPATRWRPPTPSGKTVADELARIAAEEREAK